MITFLFVGDFELMDDLPDETTLYRFGNTLTGHTDKLFKLANEDT